MNKVVRRVDHTTGIISTVVGNSTLRDWWGGVDDETNFLPASGDWGPPASAYIGEEMYLFLGGSDRSMYIAGTGIYCVRRVTLYDTLR